MIDLNELEQRVDIVLDNETPESLAKWIKERDISLYAKAKVDRVAEDETQYTIAEFMKREQALKKRTDSTT